MNSMRNKWSIGTTSSSGHCKARVVRTALGSAILATLVSVCVGPMAGAADPETDETWTTLFDGKTFKGWEGNQQWFRIQDGCIVGGNLQHDIPRNEFLCTEESFGDFELKLQVKLVGAGVNAGVQLRSQRIPNHHEVSGYQADAGEGWWGKLYDESRRDRVLAAPEASVTKDLVRPEWNDYRIICQGPRIRLWLNDKLTVDYTEKESDVARQGLIGVQIHAGPPSEAWYRHIEVRRLPDR